MNELASCASVLGMQQFLDREYVFNNSTNFAMFRIAMSCTQKYEN